MIIADTGLWIALGSNRDRHHAAARRSVAGLLEPLVTTWPVLTEACHILATRVSPKAAIGLVRAVHSGVADVFALLPAHGERISVLMEKYADLPMDLADASLVVLAEHLGHGRILTTDVRDFRSYRWKSREPFENLLVPD